MPTEEIQEKTRVTYAHCALERQAIDELRQTAYNMTGKMGRRITLSEALHILVTRYGQDSDFDFLKRDES
jgi:hypothetical protein